MRALCIYKVSYPADSEEPAEAKADAHDKEEHCFDQQGYPERFGEGEIPAGDVAFRAGADAGFAGDALTAAQALLIQFQVNGAAVGAGVTARDALFAVAVELRKGQHRQQRENGTHRAEELAEEPGMQCHAQHDQHKQQDADALRGLGQAQGREQGEHFPRTVRGEFAVHTRRAERKDTQEHQIFEFLAPEHSLFRQGELFFAVEQLFLHQPGKGIHPITQAAKGAHKAAEEAAEEDGEPAQAEQREDEAVQLEHFAAADAQEQLFCAVESGHKGTRHRHKEEQLHGDAQAGAELLRPLPLLRGGQRFLFRFFHHAAAFPSASATASIRPAEVRVAPETVSTSVVWPDSILSSTGRD